MNLNKRIVAPGLLWLTALIWGIGCAGGASQPGDESRGTGQSETSGTADKQRVPDQSTASGDAELQPDALPAGQPDDFDYILNKYVQDDFFDYAGLHANKDDLARFESFMKWQAEADVDSMSRADQIAFYINAYNACCIKAVLDRYPVHSPNDIDGFFDKLTFQVGGEMLKIGGSDGDSIEYDRLIANYKDMRAHFAVVCADRGCLPLKGGAYTGKELDADLEAAAQRFVNDQRHFKVDKENKVVHVSKIFEWYGEKFLKDPQRQVDGDRPELYLLNWIEDEQTRQLLVAGDYQRKIIEWDWTLNEKR